LLSNFNQVQLFRKKFCTGIN